MEIITYLQLFASFWCNAILSFAPGIIRYRQFALIMAFISAAAIIQEIAFKKRMKLSIVTARTFIIYLVIVFLYALTPIFYGGKENESYTSFFLVLVGQVFPASLTATIVADNKSMQEKIKKLVPFISAIFCLLAFYGVFFPNSITTGGLTDNENGLNYQSVSYLAAYAAALGEYYLVTREEKHNYTFMQSKVMSVIIAITILADFVAILVSGGRGGLAAFMISTAFTIYVMFIKGRISVRGLIKLAIVVLVIIGLGFIGLRFARNTSLATSGLDRLEYYLKYGNTLGDMRSIYHNQAMEAFKSSPIIGHGFGSIFYLLGRHSHGCIYDALAETGLIGTAIFIYVIAKTFICGFKFLKTDPSESVWIYFFLCGFSVSLFSNYYLSHVPMYWGASFIFAAEWLRKRAKKETENAEKGIMPQT